MSIKLMSIAWDMDIPSTEKMVLLCLCDYADDDGRSCYPAISTLAKRTSKNARTVQRALRWLEQSGICASHTRAGTSTNYTISLGGDILSGVTKTTKGGGKVSGEGRRGVTQSINEPPIRLDTKVSNSTKPKFELPDWIPKEAWDGFEEMRRTIKKPMTDRARSMIVKELQNLSSAPGAILDQSTRNNWQDVYELKDKSNGKSTGQGSADGMGSTERAARRAFSEITGGTSQFSGGGAQVSASHIGGGNPVIDAMPNAVRTIGYDGG